MSNFSKKFFKIIKICLILVFFQNFENVNSISNCILVHFNGQIITKFDLKERLRLIAFFNGTSFENIAQNEELRTSILKSLVDEKILLEKADSLKLKPKEEELEQFTKNFFLNASINVDEFGGVKSFLKENKLSYKAFEGFILNEIIVGKLVEHYKDEINQSKENEKFFKALNQIQKKSEYVKYDILEFSIVESPESLEKIQNFQSLENCQALKENLEKLEINFEEYILDVSSMNQDLLNQIKSQGERKIGFVPFRAPTSEENDKQMINFISFCPNGPKQTSEIRLNEIQLDVLRQKTQIRKMISDIINDGKSQNYIVFNEKCKSDSFE